jgi:KaiC/GvpD/RAD55 family RecA-like ATPase
MFQKTIKGLDKIFTTNNYGKLTILVAGYAGTMKSTFVYSLMAKYLENNSKKIGMYATLEQTKDSLMTNIKNIGIKEYKNLHIADYNRTRDMYKNESETADFLDLTERLIISTKEEHGNDFVVFALDSINSLYTLINTEKPKDVRKRIYYFFKLLRDNNLTSYIIKETPKPIGGLYQEGFDEAYLVDGIIELGVKKIGDNKKRYIEIPKMRQNEHSMRPFIFEVKKGISIIGPTVDDTVGP